MRPDYTLSIWPTTYRDEVDAEINNKITHIHFDAKYRVDNLIEIFGPKDDAVINIDNDLDVEKIEQKNGKYKRADLLKMHAYKDAIRRTHGAYVIYPGELIKINSNDNEVADSNIKYYWKEYHEILPGLGAFALHPRCDMEEKESDTLHIENFLNDIRCHLINNSNN
jgi:predicted component of viral defense system (DUF524 family)